MSGGHIMTTRTLSTPAWLLGIALGALATLAGAAPSVSLTAPAANTVYAAGSTITLTANAADSDGSVTKVEFYQGSTLIGTVTSAPYSLAWNDIPAGTYTLSAQATDNQGAVGSSAPLSVTVGANGVAVYYLHTDHLNTPRLVMDEQNVVVWRSQPLVEPFGNSPPEEDPDGNGIAFTMNLRFPGQYFDKESNLNYNTYRDYNPTTGRYIQSDPIGLLGGINTYGYVQGNPLRYIDPKGLGPWDKLYGWSKEFWHWFHGLDGGDLMKELKDPCTKQVSKQDAQPYYDEWKSLKDKEGGWIDPGLIPELLIPFLWTPSSTGGCDAGGVCSDTRPYGWWKNQH